MAIVLENGKKKAIGDKVGITRQAVSQILSGKRPGSPKGRLVRGLAYEAGGRYLMDFRTETEKDGNLLDICSWCDGAVQLICSRGTGTVYKYVCGEMVDSYQGLSIPEFMKKQNECAKYAVLNF